MKGKRKKAKNIIVILVFIFLLAVVVRSCFRDRNQITYTEEIVKNRDITTYFTFSGNIETKSSQAVFSQGVMPVKKFHVKEGDVVSKGDLLFEYDAGTILDNLKQAELNIEIAKINYEKAAGSGKQQQIAQMESALSSARLAFDNAKSNLERMTELYNTGNIAKIEFEQAKTAYDNALMSLEIAQKNYDLTLEMVEQNVRTAKHQLDQARASYSTLEKQLEDTKVYAEIDGEVDKIYVEENDSLTMGAKIMDIINYEDLQVTIKVDEYDLRAVTLDKEAEVIVSALDKTVNGRITDISRQAMVVNGVSYFPTTITIESSEDLRVGMSVEVRVLNHDIKDAVTVTMKALQFDAENKPFVYVRDSDGKVQTKYVETGVNDGTIVEIKSGVNSGDIILIPNRIFDAFYFDMRRR
ncbi:MAG: HlyD family efflux transporter periplasmic adaptor subunit [Clostridiaceae bacterium]|nr:HlyD family efflux transporter periplasmic adaptor subunit [Clostridiaceae bacterium]